MLWINHRRAALPLLSLADLITEKNGEVYKVRGMTQVSDFVVNCEALGPYLLELNDNKVSLMFSLSL